MEPHRDRIRVLVVDDEPHVLAPHLEVLRRNGYAWQLETTVAGGCRRLEAEEFDVLVTDLELPDGNGIDLIRAQAPERVIPTVIVTGHPTTGTAIGALRLQVVDYLTKPVQPPALLEAVGRAVEQARSLEDLARVRQDLAGYQEMLRRLEDTVARFSGAGTPAPRRVTPEPVVRPAEPSLLEERLTPRELEVVRALVAGHRPGEIAEQMCVSRHTVRNHLKSVYRKLDVHSQVELVALARELE